MPIYPIKCDCGHKADVYAKVGARHRIRCTECKKIAAIDFAALTGVTDLNSQYIGSEGVSRQEGFTRRAVPRARKLIGGELSECIKDDGKVVWKNSKQQDRYYKRYREVQKEQRHARGEDPEYIPGNE